MTTLVLNYSTSLLESIWEKLKGIGISFIVARQMSVNAECARFLVRNGEFKDYHEALYTLNQNVLKEWGLK
jgi:hypothetical protein